MRGIHLAVKYRVVASGVVLALLVAACGAAPEDSELVVEGAEGGRDQAARLSLAGTASFDVADSATERVTPGGITLGLDVEYFEPLMVEDWIAPDECSFDTLVEARVDGQVLRSAPFDGPRSRDRTRGVRPLGRGDAGGRP